MVQIERLDASEPLCEYLGQLRRELALDSLHWRRRQELVQQPVRVCTDLLLSPEFVESPSFVEAGEQEPHVNRVRCLAPVTSAEFIHHEGDQVDNSLEPEDLVVSTNHWSRVIIDFFKTTLVDNFLHQECLELLGELRLINGIISIDENAELEWQSDWIDVHVIVSCEQGLHLGGVTGVRCEERQCASAVAEDLVIGCALGLVRQNLSHCLVDSLGHCGLDSLTFGSDDQCEALRDLNLLFAVDFAALNKGVELFDDGINSWDTFDEEDEVFDHDPSGVVSG